MIKSVARFRHRYSMLVLRTVVSAVARNAIHFERSLRSIFGDFVSCVGGYDMLR